MIQYPVLLIDGEIADFYDLSLHDALPISRALLRHRMRFSRRAADGHAARAGRRRGASLDADRGGLSNAGDAVSALVPRADARLDRDRSVLLVVDVQERLAPHVAGVDALIAHAGALVAAARRVG